MILHVFTDDVRTVPGEVKGSLLSAGLPMRGQVLYLTQGLYFKKKSFLC